MKGNPSPYSTRLYAVAGSCSVIIPAGRGGCLLFEVCLVR